MLRRLESITYTLFLFLTPLLVTTFSKELFEFPKTTFLYFITGILFLISSWNFNLNFNNFLQNNKIKVVIIALVLILLSNLISFVFSIDYYVSLFGYYTRFNGGLLSVICIFVWLIFLITKSLSKDNVEQSLLIIYFSGVIVSTYAVIQKFGLDKNAWNENSMLRVFSTFGQPNWLAAYLIPIFFLAIYFRNKYNIPTTLKFIPLIIIYTAILFTYSISGIFALFVSLTIYILLNLKQTKNYIVRNWYLILIIFALTISLAIPFKNRIAEQINNMTGIVDLLKTDNSQNLKANYGDSGKIRLILWDGTLNLITSSTKQFLIGSGPETFAHRFPEFRPDSINATSEATFVHNKPHNWYLEIFANLGLLGITSYLIFIVAIIYSFIKAEKTSLSKIIFCGWVSILITNFFGWPTVTTSILFFILPVFLNYKLLNFVENSKPIRVSSLKLFILFSLGNILILSSTVIMIADSHYKKGDYYTAHKINPFEPRYELFDIIYSRYVDAERIKSFYYENKYNPYVVKTLVTYLTQLTKVSNVSEDILNLKIEVMKDAGKVSPNDRQFRI